jgi:hypothetical protein
MRKKRNDEAVPEDSLGEVVRKTERLPKITRFSSFK